MAVTIRVEHSTVDATIRVENSTTMTASTPIEETCMHRMCRSRATTELLAETTTTEERELSATPSVTEETYRTSSRTELHVLAETTMEQSATPIVMEDSGDDSSNTITLVTPRKGYVCSAPSKFLTPVQETSPPVSEELVCQSNMNNLLL